MWALIINYLNSKITSVVHLPNSLSTIGGTPICPTSLGGLSWNEYGS